MTVAQPSAVIRSSVGRPTQRVEVVSRQSDENVRIGQVEAGDVGWVYVKWNPCTVGHLSKSLP